MTKTFLTRIFWESHRWFIFESSYPGKRMSGLSSWHRCCVHNLMIGIREKSLTVSGTSYKCASYVAKASMLAKVCNVFKGLLRVSEGILICRTFVSEGKFASLSCQKAPFRVVIHVIGTHLAWLWPAHNSHAVMLYMTSGISAILRLFERLERWLACGVDYGTAPTFSYLSEGVGVNYSRFTNKQTFPHAGCSEYKSRIWLLIHP